MQIKFLCALPHNFLLFHMKFSLYILSLIFFNLYEGTKFGISPAKYKSKHSIVSLKILKYSSFASFLSFLYSQNFQILMTSNILSNQMMSHKIIYTLIFIKSFTTRFTKFSFINISFKYFFHTFKIIRGKKFRYFNIH